MLVDFVKKFKKSFTLLEVLIVCGFFSIVILAIIGAITRAYDFMNNNRMQVRAVNFAREGVEMMFNIRDTNWRRNSGEKDKSWKILGTGDDNFTDGIYVLKEGKISEDTYIYASGLNLNQNEVDSFYGDGFWDDSNSNYRESAKIIFTGTYNYLTGEYDENTEEWHFKSETGDVAELLGGNSEFYRVVRVYDVIGKLNPCEGYACPEEMRFCVKVFYRNKDAKRSSELCSIMTNFEE